MLLEGVLAPCRPAQGPPCPGSLTGAQGQHGYPGWVRGLGRRVVAFFLKPGAVCKTGSELVGTPVQQKGAGVHPGCMVSWGELVFQCYCRWWLWEILLLLALFHINTLFTVCRQTGMTSVQRMG